MAISAVASSVCPRVAAAGLRIDLNGQGIEIPWAANNMRAIIIRPFRAEDVADLIVAFRDAARNAAPRDYTESQVSAWAPDLIDPAAFARRCADKSTWVAEYEQRVAGFSDIEPEGHIDMLFVHPDFQRRGVARALLEHIERHAQARGMDRLYTEASITARPVFESAGFHVLAAQTVSIRGATMTNYRMEKQLLP
jgi:putative acetyltransferase